VAHLISRSCLFPIRQPLQSFSWPIEEPIWPSPHVMLYSVLDYGSCLQAGLASSTPKKYVVRFIQMIHTAHMALNPPGIIISAQIWVPVHDVAPSQRKPSIDERGHASSWVLCILASAPWRYDEETWYLNPHIFPLQAVSYLVYCGIICDEHYLDPSHRGSIIEIP